MENGLLKTMLWSQFGAALQMLENALFTCPDELWEDRSKGKPYRYQVYHTLFFLDLYLSDSLKEFAPPPPFTIGEISPKPAVPEKAYAKSVLKEYLEHGRWKCRARIDAMTEGKMLQRCGFKWVDVSFGELFLYNMRHVQHHAAQLNLILRQTIDRAPSWVFKA